MSKIENRSGKVIRGGITIFVLIITLLMTIPLYITVVNIFKPTDLISASPLTLPSPPILDNIKTVLSDPNVSLSKMYFNSICITFFGTSICILVSSMAGYYLARTASKFSKKLYVYFLLGLMVPYVIVYVPLISMYKNFGIIGNLPGLIIVFVSGSISFSVFMYQGFIKSIPIEVEEAALIDGANQFTIYFNIVLPLVKSCTTSVAIFIGLSMWNDFLTPLLIGQVPTITVGIYTAIGSFSADWGTVFAYVLFATAPIVIIYILAQKQFVKGLTAGAIKG